MIITHSAKLDFQHIFEYIAQDNVASAENFIHELTKKAFNIADLGLTGNNRDIISIGLRVFPFRKYCLYFEIDDDQMILLRVLRSSQDINLQEFDIETED